MIWLWNFVSLTLRLKHVARVLNLVEYIDYDELMQSVIFINPVEMKWRCSLIRVILLYRLQFTRYTIYNRTHTQIHTNTDSLYETCLRTSLQISQQSFFFGSHHHHRHLICSHKVIKLRSFSVNLIYASLHPAHVSPIWNKEKIAVDGSPTLPHFQFFYKSCDGNNNCYPWD